MDVTTPGLLNTVKRWVVVIRICQVIYLQGLVSIVATHDVTCWMALALSVCAFIDSDIVMLLKQLRRVPNVELHMQRTH